MRFNVRSLLPGVPYSSSRENQSTGTSSPRRRIANRRMSIPQSHRHSRGERVSALGALIILSRSPKLPREVDPRFSPRSNASSYAATTGRSTTGSSDRGRRRRTSARRLAVKKPSVAARRLSLVVETRGARIALLLAGVWVLPLGWTFTINRSRSLSNDYGSHTG